MILLSICIGVPLLVLYPFMFFGQIFNSRLSFHLSVDIEDYKTCDKDYEKFIVDEPRKNIALHKFYIWNVTNPADVMQKGYKPLMVEAGPYAYEKKTYKYDVSFDTNSSSTTVSFKEYSVLEEVTNQVACERMYYRMGNADVTLTDPCADGACLCQSHSDIVTVVNPLFLKLLYEESPAAVLALFSVEVFSTIKDLLLGPFLEAVNAYLVNRAYQEIYEFRRYYHGGTLLQIEAKNITSREDFNASSTFIGYFRNVYTGDKSCGLDDYNLPCSFTGAYDNFQYQMSDVGGITLTRDEYLPVINLFNASYNSSLLDMDIGFPRWIALCKYYNYIPFGAAEGIISVTSAEIEAYISQLTADAVLYAANSNTTTSSSRMLVLIKSVAYWVGTSILGTNLATYKDMTLEEFRTTHEPVVCAPNGLKCVWQYGYMNHYHASEVFVSTRVMTQLIDLITAVNTNPVSIFYVSNGIMFYNAFQYCYKVHFPATSAEDLSCMDYANTYDDGLTNQPASLWAVAQGISTVDKVEMVTKYSANNETVKLKYLHHSCNFSTLLYTVYRNATSFHQHFVVRFLNRFKDPTFSHDFTVGKEEEIAYAQFGGGYATHALVGVRACNSFTRDSMWKFGTSGFYTSLIELSSWAITTGFPTYYITDPADAKVLLTALSQRNNDGVRFRSHIIDIGTTFFGNGFYYENGVGDLGDITFTSEANRGNFSCPVDPVATNRQACSILQTNYTSSAVLCTYLDETLYKVCRKLVITGNKWIDNCEKYQTSMTSPILGISCDKIGVFGKVHPYSKSIGNILFQMLYSLTLDLRIKAGLWCPQFDGCQFTWGGMFTTSTVERVLFQGFTDPGVLRFLNMKHETDDISFRCASNSKDQCGVEILHCDKSGIIMTLPSGGEKLLSYDGTPKDEFFAPYLEVVASDSEMIWRYGRNVSAVRRAREVAADNSKSVVRVFNPIWAAFPAWNTNDTGFIKYYQCQKRLLMGPPLLYKSCVDKLDTGRVDIKTALNILAFQGNESIYLMNHKGKMSVGGSSTQFLQNEAELWQGFYVYPYLYDGLTKGAAYDALKAPVLFNKQYGVKLTLSQDFFTFDFEKNKFSTLPITDGPLRRNFTKTLETVSRRFTETETTWDALTELSEAFDSFGMPHDIPKGMASLERSTGMPFYIGTPHCYGNEDWGGLEFGHVAGYSPYRLAHRTFLDYDPVSGQSIIQALRHQLHVRVERNALFLNAFSSQERCVPPTKSFSGGTGYGCFSYIPLYWYEDARVVDTDVYFRRNDHFLTRPARSAMVLTIGIVLTLLLLLSGTCLCISEQFNRKKFLSRVYVD